MHTYVCMHTCISRTESLTLEISFFSLVRVDPFICSFSICLGVLHAHTHSAPNPPHPFFSFVLVWTAASDALNRARHLYHDYHVILYE